MLEVFLMSKALKPRQGSAITAKERKKFLEVLRTTFNVSKAAEAIGRNRTSLYKLRQSDPEFAAAWDEIVEQCLDAVEQVVFENALAGKQPVNNIFLLRHRRAHIYGEKVTVEQDHPREVVVVLHRATDPRLGPGRDDVVDAEKVESVDKE